MSHSFDLDPVGRITAGAVGDPGHRTFFLQARKDDVLVTLLAEKEQVQALAATLEHLLDTMGHTDPAPDEEIELEEPLVPEWRIGPMGIEVDEERQMIVLVAEEASAADEDEPAQEIPEPAHARFVATPVQMRALAEQADRVCAAGRPRCRLCGFPIEPDGHACPALNGHRRPGE